jgi:hypothetical protein
MIAPQIPLGTTSLGIKLKILFGEDGTDYMVSPIKFHGKKKSLGKRGLSANLNQVPCEAIS